MIVVDASVAAKWVLNEGDSPAARTLLGGQDELVAPELLRLDGMSAITRAARNGRLDAVAVEIALDAWFALLASGRIELVPIEIYLRPTAALSCDLRHPLYDCFYLVLAQRLNAILVTTDGTFARRPAAVWPRARLLGT